MKRSLFIAIVVLLMAALFVSCNADKAVEDQLFEVTIDGGARALDLTSEFTAADIDSLFWYYEATKADGGQFTTGQTTEKTPVKKANDAAAVGITSASLGSFSRGDWTFKFYGYDKALTDTTAQLIYSSEASATLKRNLSLDLTLKAETVAGASVYMEGVTFTSTQMDLTADYDSIKLFIEPFGATAGYEGTVSENTATFAATLIKDNVEAGSYAVKFTVKGYYTEDNDTKEEKLGEFTSNVQIVAGMKYTFSDSVAAPGIDEVELTGEIEIGDVDAPQTSSERVTETLSSTEDVTFISTNNPKAKENETTSVTFPAGAAGEGEAVLTVTAYNAAASQGNFQIQDSGNKPIAGLDLSLSTASAFEDYVTVSTYVGTGIANPTVVYDGTAEQPKNVQYDATTGYISFDTNHFSSFYVFEAEAKIGTTVYTTLNDAVTAAEAGATVTLLKDASFSQIKVSKNLTIDLGGNTLTSRFTVLGGEVLVKNGEIEGRVDAYDDVLTIDTDATVSGYVMVWGDSTALEAPTANIYGTVNGFIQLSASNNDSYQEVVNIYESASINGEGIWAYNSGIVNITGGTIISPETVGVALYNSATLNMSAGTINAYSFGISNNGVGTNQTITVSGGSITSETAAAIYHAGLGTTTVSGDAALTGVTGIEIRAGELNISGSPVISGTATSISVEPNGNGSTTAGAGIAIAQHTTKKDITVSVTGGTISGVYAVDIENPQGNLSGEGTLAVSISGATLNSTAAYQIMKNDSRVVLDAEGYTKGMTITVSGGSVEGDPFADE